jgi:hypothetical protein
MNAWCFSTAGAVLQCGTRRPHRLAADPPCDIRNVMIPMWFLDLKLLRERASDTNEPITSRLEADDPVAGALETAGRQRAALEPSPPSRDRSWPRDCRSWVGLRGEAICQIPLTMKIVYTQGCSFGPGRDNQLSYTRTIQRWRRPVEARLRVVAGERSETLRCSTSAMRLDASLGDEPWRDEM